MKSIAVVCIVVMMAACSSAPTAVTDYDQTFDFRGKNKLAIQPFDRSNPATVTVSDIQVGRINETLTAELQRRGFSVVADNNSADLLLSWHLVTQERTDVRSFNSASRYSCWSCPAGGGVSVRQYTQGTFIVDLIDPQSLRSIWRSTMQSRMNFESDPAKAAETRRAAAATIFAQFPPQ